MTARDRTVVMVVVTLVALAAGWLLVVSPRRATAAKLGNSIQAAQQQLATLEAQVASEQRARTSFSADYVELAQLGEAVPQDDNVPSLLVELQSAARASNVDFRGLQLTSGGSAAPVGASTAATSASGGPSATGGAAATPSPPGVTTSAGFGAEQFTFTFTGHFFDLSDFLGRVENFVVANGSLVQVSGRLMTLNAISLGPAQQGLPEMTASVSATTYLLPASQGLFDGATSAAPAAASAGSAGTATAPGAGGLPAAPGGATGSSSAPAGATGSSATPAAAISAPSAISGGSR
jgi:Type II secretion system (T2SS), protein M